VQAEEGDNPLTKFGRGLIGLALGWLELPGNMVQVAEEDGVGMGLTAGLLKGIGMTALRYVVSAFEVGTFLFPIPPDYKAVIEPEFPWGYFEEGNEASAAGRVVKEPQIVPAAPAVR
jgi:putative exosortase-associated protein (TIGR04073 family)